MPHARLEVYFIVRDGFAKKLPDGATFKPIGRGARRFVDLSTKDHLLAAAPLNAESLKNALAATSSGKIGSPVGLLGEEMVFQVIRVE